MKCLNLIKYYSLILYLVIYWNIATVPITVRNIESVDKLMDNGVHEQVKPSKMDFCSLLLHTHYPSLYFSQWILSVSCVEFLCNYFHYCLVHFIGYNQDFYLQSYSLHFDGTECYGRSIKIDSPPITTVFLLYIFCYFSVLLIVKYCYSYDWQFRLPG